MKLLILITLFCCTISAISQTENDSLDSVKTNDSTQISKWIFHQKNDFHLELLGAAGLYSINYERVIVNGNRFKTLASIGFSYMGTKSWRGFIIPISINQLLSFKEHHIELGIGASPNFVISNAFGENWYQFIFTRIGYRYQKPKGKFIFRGGAIPIVYPEFGIWGGISIGHSF
jgi:hypothetical protein